MGTTTKGLIAKDDLKLYDGVNSTFTRKTSSGGTGTYRVFDWFGVDALQVYGSGTSRTNATISAALSAIGITTKASIFLSPGTWTISASVDWSAYTNVEFVIPRGAILSRGAYTINMPNPRAGIYQIFSGTGAVTFSGFVSECYPEWFGVDGTADNTEIQLAVNAVSALKSPVILSASGYTVAGAITLSGNNAIYSKGSNSLITLATSTDANLFLVTGDNVTVRDINADGNKANQASGSFLKVEDQAGSIDNLHVENCEITDFKEYGIHVANACANHRFLNNKFDSSDKTGILVSPDTVTESCDNIRMEGNHVISAGVNGLQVYNSTNSNNSNIFIKGNYVINTTAVPIEIQRAIQGIVSENIVEGGGTNGISVGSCQHLTVSNNVVSDQSNYGIELADVSEGGNLTVTGNEVYSCGTGIITVDGGGDYGSMAVIANNVIDTTTSQEGIDCQHLSKLSISGNVIKDPNTVGIRVHGVDDAIEALSDVMVNNNIINFTVASTSGPQGISVASISGGTISNNQIISAISGSSEWDAMIGIGKGNKNLHVIDNELIGTVALTHTGISVTYSNSGSFIYLLRNHIRHTKRGILASSCTDPRVYISANIIEESSTADITAHASHRLDKLAASPTQGAMWNAGDVVWETAPTDSNPPGWICSSNVKTEMRVAAIETDTTMEVDDTTGMTTGDICGVELDNGTWHWTTVTVTDGDTLELAAGLSGDGAAIDNEVIVTQWQLLAECGTVKA